MNENIELKGVCYALLQIDKFHPIAERRHELIWYPERAMTLLGCIKYRPYVNSIVTENPWLIACYDRDNVRIWVKDYGWRRPNIQTYGADADGIMSRILGIKQSMPSTPLDGGDAIDKLILKIWSERP